MFTSARTAAGLALTGWANGSFAVILMAMSILAEFRKYDIPKR
jgi:hypothetical protein